MKYQSLEQLKNNRSSVEFVQYEERDPCYTWLYPIDLSDFHPNNIWENKPHFTRLRNELTLYVHIPFCTYICRMCPFTHEPLHKFDLSAYVDALIHEIKIYSGLPEISKRAVSSLYFGGGTASSLQPNQLAKILEALRLYYCVDEHTEITLECHPRTVNKQYLRDVKSCGINRVSFGIQSFNQQNIKSLKLHQKTEQSIAILETAINTGFDTVSMDLMYRYPGQTVSSLEKELDTVFKIGVHGLSVYSLDAEVGGLEDDCKRQSSILEEAEMYYYFHDRLIAEGWIHVAQPDYSKRGHENRQLYDLWGAPQCENLAFGAGAFSENFNGNTWANIHNPARYIELMNKEFFPIALGMVHGWDDSVSRYPALGVRCLKVPLKPFHDTFGIDFINIYKFEIELLKGKGWIDIADNMLTVTRKGKFFIDNISKTFFNLRNRGKPQLWGIQLQSFEPSKIYKIDEIKIK